MFTFWNVFGKVMLAVVLLLLFNTLVSIPILVAGIVTVGIEDSLQLGAEGLTESLAKFPLLNTAMFVLSGLCGVLAAWVMYKAFERNRTWSLGWVQQSWARKGAFGLLIGALLITISFLLLLMLGGVRVTGITLTGEVLWLVSLHILVFLAVGIGEEVFSRGYIYGLVRKYGGIPAAIVVSTLVFALLHSMNAGVFINAFPMVNLMLAGVMLALLREASGGLWVPIGVHITWNFFQGNVYGMPVSGNHTASILQLETLRPWLAGGRFGLEGSFIITLVIAAACIVCLAVMKKRAQWSL